MNQQGNGALPATILTANPQTIGSLFDQAHVRAGAADALERFAHRLQVVTGSFFQSVPVAAMSTPCPKFCTTGTTLKA